MTIKEMQDTIIMHRGFEDEMTIWFFSVCADKTIGKNEIEDAFVAAIAAPLDLDI